MQPNSFFKTLNSIYSNLNSDPIHSFGGLLWSAVSENFEVGDIEETRETFLPSLEMYYDGYCLTCCGTGSPPLGCVCQLYFRIVVTEL